MTETIDSDLECVPSSFDRLTERQKEILVLVYQRHSSKEIAQKLDISPKTVDHHLDIARRLLHSSTRLQAARTYWESLPKASLPVVDRSDLEPYGPAARGERQTDEGIVYQPPESHWRPPSGRTLWPDPSNIGPGTRIALILAGALCIILMLGAATALMSGLYTLLTMLRGEPGPG
ncbi:helix-turn-helix domain-containing protein [Alteriqipengyuania lutimaris]|uniref:helix-turn-helix domain-containing protein n=1 Tax=Alteriqipengyuania lutimaris TaxID=1538146 RepID=UPI0015F164F5|nr:helix-turn-helix transcriptional regulator [Alteriqipengyuania lutimaris]MBB3034077.1 DNA-binding CsgD family transcriptional regulator [Alteriqipengyuania lutimaris]